MASRSRFQACWLLLGLALLLLMMGLASSKREPEVEIADDTDVQVDEPAEPEPPAKPRVKRDKPVEVPIDIEGPAEEITPKTKVPKKATPAPPKPTQDDEEDEDGGEGEDDEEGQQQEEKQVYIIDELSEFNGDLRAVLVVDEITEYYDEEGVTWYKVQLHLQNKGKVAICGATFDISNSSQVAETWTLERIKKTNTYQLLWAFNISAEDPKTDSRYFGVVTEGSGVPDIHIHDLKACDEKELNDAPDDGEDDAQAAVKEDEDPNVPSIEDARRLVAKGGPHEDDVSLEVDEMTTYVELTVDEVQRNRRRLEGEQREVLINAHLSNRASFALCGVHVWVFNFSAATDHWGVSPIVDLETGEMLEDVALPSSDSRLDPGQVHYFGFIMPMDSDYPNVVVTKAKDCEGYEGEEEAILEEGEDGEAQLVIDPAILES